MILPQRGIRDVRRKDIPEFALRAILLKVPEYPRRIALLLLPAEAAPIDIRAERHGAEVRRGDDEPAGPDKRVIEELPRRRVRHVRRDETQLGVHGRRADVAALLEIVLVGRLTAAVGDPAGEVDLLGVAPFLALRLGHERVGRKVRRVLFHDPVILVWVLHPDGPLETHVVECADDLPLLVQAAVSAVAVHGEPECIVFELRPAVLCPPADVGVQFLVRAALGPELEDLFSEDAAGDQCARSILIWQFYDTVWGLGEN